MLFAKTIMPEAEGDHLLSQVQKMSSTTKHAKLTDEEAKQIVDIVAAGNLNMSICFFNQNNYVKSKEKAQMSLDTKVSMKAYYRRAQAKAYLKDFDGACDDLK